MPVFPAATQLTFTLAASSVNASVFATSIDYTYTTQDFDRQEFSNNKLRSAKNTDGSQAIFLTTFSGKLVQVSTTCGTVAIRPVTPDDNNATSIFKRFNIKRYQISLDHSSPSAVDSLFTVATEHAKRLARFNYYQKQSQSLDASYDYLVSLQAETFSYLTSTGLTMAGTDINETNCLITSMNPGHLIENVSAGTITTKGGSLTVEVRTLVAGSTQ